MRKPIKTETGTKTGAHARARAPVTGWGGRVPGRHESTRTGAARSRRSLLQYNYVDWRLRTSERSISRTRAISERTCARMLRVARQSRRGVSGDAASAAAVWATARAASVACWAAVMDTELPNVLPSPWCRARAEANCAVTCFTHTV